jgi:CRISPR-associated protein Csx10
MGLDGKRDRAEAGYYTSIGKFERYKLSRRMIAGTSIRRTTHTAAHSMLFSHEVIEESSAYPETGVYFRGVINLPGDLRQLLLDLLPIGQELSVGYGRSRGWGLVQAQSWSSPRTPTTTLQERWQALNDAASQLWSAYALQPVGQYFSLTLSSHLLLRNPVGQPVLGNLQPADLGLPGNLERCRCVIHPVLVHGWNALMGRPKQDHWAIGRGSVLLFRMPLEADASPVIARLEEIQQSGIGDRLCEGFGQMVACDPFHYHFIPRELKGATR